jgi:hypothetical protein
MRRFTLVTALMVLAALACNAPTGPADVVTPGGPLTITPSAGNQNGTTQPSATTSGDATQAPGGSVVLPAPLYFIGDDEQIWRIETDGTTEIQITDEAESVTDFDISPVYGSIAYVTGNALYNIDSMGGNRALLVESPGNPEENDEARILRSVGAVHWSPDGQKIAFGLGGIQVYDIVIGTPTMLKASDPVPDLSGSAPFPEGPIRFFYPGPFSPDGSVLMAQYSFYPEGGGTAVLNLSDNSLIDIAEDGHSACCGQTWSLDSSSIYWAFSYPGMLAAGMWRADAPSWVATTLIHGESEGGWMLPGSPQQLSDGKLYYFFATTDIYPDQPSPLTMTRSEPDGVTGVTALRTDAFLMYDALWDPNGSGAVIMNQDGADSSSFPFVAPLLWLPTDGSPPVSLPRQGRLLRWGK